MKAKKAIAVLSVAVMMTGMLAGCTSGNTTDTAAANTTEAGTTTEMSETRPEGTSDNNGTETADLSEHVEITIGGINMVSSDTVEGWPTEIVQQIEEKFNVTLKTKPYDNESLNLDLSGGTTCDIVQINDDHIAGVLKGKHAVDLDTYGDIAKNINSDKMSFRNDVIRTFKSNGEGKLYFVTPRVLMKDTDPSYGANLNYGYVVRWDLYKQIGCPEISNDDEYIEALKKMKEIYPETEEGLPVYALGVMNDMQLFSYFFKGCLNEGYANLEGGIYVQNALTNELVPDLYDAGNPEVVTPFWSGVKFYNKLYKEGLLDPDCFITKQEDLRDKYTKGQYLGGIVDWHFGVYNEKQRVGDPETLNQYVVLPAKLGWTNEQNRAGWTGKYFFVSSHSPNVERAVMVLDYIQSEECSRIIDSGVEGRWEKSEKGTSELTQDTIQLKMDGNRLDEWKKSGIGSTFSDMAGFDGNNVAADGGKISLWNEADVLTDSLTAAQKDMCETLGLSLPSDLLKNKIESGEGIDLSNCKSYIRSGIEITPKDIVRIDSNCEELTMNALPDLIQAEDDAAFAAAKEKLINQLKDAGAQDSVDWWQSAWETTLKGLENIE